MFWCCFNVKGGFWSLFDTGIESHDFLEGWISVEDGVIFQKGWVIIEFHSLTNVIHDDVLIDWNHTWSSCSCREGKT